MTLVRLERSTAAAGATVGGTIGVNIGGQINAGNVNSLVADNALSSAKIGKFIASDNFNGTVDANGNVTANGSAGWAIGKGGKAVFNDVDNRGSFNVGAFTGYAWPASGQYGAHLSASGLLIGNANNGKYLQVTQDGNIYTPGFDVVNGTMTVKQANVINTLNLAGNAVTIPAAVSSEADLAVATGLGDETVTLSLVFASSGQPIVISTSFFIKSSGSSSSQTVRLRRNGVELWVGTITADSGYARTIIDLPGVGTHTYSLTAKRSGFSNMGPRSLVLLEVKR